MPLPVPSSDADLLVRAADGDHAAVAALYDQHADAVHDHVARWSRDTTLAAEATAAAFSGLLDDVAAGSPPVAVRPTLLRSAREHVLARLRAADGPVPGGLSDATLAATAAGGAHADVAAAWTAAAELEGPDFTVLDLATRHGLDVAAIGAVIGMTTADVAARLERVRRLVPTADYAALAAVRAPVTVRSAVTAAAATRLGAHPADRLARLRTGAAVAAVLLVLGVLGGAMAMLRNGGPEPAAGPATAAAEPVASPSPSPTPVPSPTATLEALPSPSPVPVATPEPTVDPDPSPSPSPTPAPSPSPSPSPTPTPLVLQVDQPAAGSSFGATEEDGAGRQSARVPVAATVTGGSGDARVTWTSSRAPTEVLLTGTEGDVLLWLEEPCTDTTHALTATATDEVTGETSSATVEVVAMETCAEPLAVDITRPAEGETVTAQRRRNQYVAVIDVAATANDTDLTWAWTADRGAGGVLLDQPSGEVRVVLDDCAASTELVLQVDVERPGDGATATDTVRVTVACVG